MNTLKTLGNLRGWRRLGIGMLIGCGVVRAAAAADLGAEVQFNRDVRPILSDNCFNCHGLDEQKRKGKLRLDRRESALAMRDGRPAIVPNNVEASELWHRITAPDENDIMPPPESHKKLTREQKETLRRWIAQGAEYQGHWAFEAPERPSLPNIKNTRWARNGVDYFIAAKLADKNLKPSPEADRETLIRRVTFDLTGLPPTPSEVDAFLADRKPGAYERVVDRLLQSPRYGEHEARYWLDVARYGDTHGLHLDNERSLWPYRDWVVQAFNRNLAFDEFTIEQLAGDLLPNPTAEQRIASGFNRCNVSTSEGGAIDEEFYVRYAVDRTETTAGVWMGLTAGCAACHDHKYDPISQKEFYQLYAFFNSLTEKAMDGNALLPPPVLKLPSPEQLAMLERSNTAVTAVEKRLREELERVAYTEPPRTEMADSQAEVIWLEDDFPAGATVATNGGNVASRWLQPALIHSGKRSLAIKGRELARESFTNATQPLLIGKGDLLFAYVFLDPEDPPQAVMLEYYSASAKHRANWGKEDVITRGDHGGPTNWFAGGLPTTGQWVRIEIEAEKIGLKPGAKVHGMSFTQFGGTAWWDHAGLVTATSQKDASGVSQLAWEEQESVNDPSPLPKPVGEAIKKPTVDRTPEQVKLLREHYLTQVYKPARAIFEPLLKEQADLRKQRDDFDNSLAATMVSQEMEKPRDSFLLKRGQYDQPGDLVRPGVPAMLPPLRGGATTNRLDLARWLVSPEHPLTARVTVNRFWQQFFGTGLVKSSGDFGAQGHFPSHPELLDWLATEFMAGHWDVKQLVQLIVTSATYRQSSHVTPKLLAADPENRLLARGPRFRLDAEMIRDNALFVSGLLVETMGGRGVRPYQPAGIWEAVGYTSSNTAKFEQDHGEALYRRSLYTFWKRTAPPPYFTTFDAPSREKFCVRRERANTPLQALVTMNDPAYVEAARHLSARMMDHDPRADERLEFGFRLVTARRPSSSEKAVLRDSLKKYLAKYQIETEAARKLISVGESPANKKLDASELAAYTMVASLLLNLDETLNKN